MRESLWLWCLAAGMLATGVLCEHPASASMAVGVNRLYDVRVQEIWAEGSAYYCLHNARPETIELSVSERHIVSHHTILRHGDEMAIVSGPTFASGDSMAAWIVGPGEAMVVQAARVRPDSLFEFLMDGYAIGTCVERAQPETIPSGVFASFSPLNSPGGRRYEAWVEQDSLWFTGGELFRVELVIASGAGEVRFKHPAQGESPDALRVLTASCPTLPIADWGGELRIDAVALDPPGAYHRVSLLIEAPDVACPTMVPLFGMLWEEPHAVAWGISRGFLIRP